MRVAIYEPHPRVAGPVVWAQHLKQGFLKEGHECDLVTVTRSGKKSIRWGPGTGKVNRGWSWSAMVPDVVLKGEEAAAAFDAYDLIILTEPKSSPFDRWALKQRGEKGVFADRHPDKVVKDKMPEYLTWLESTSTPWTSALHGPQYQRARAPFLAELLALPNFTGHLMTTVDSFADTAPNGLLRDLAEIHVHQPLPYVPRLPLDAPIPTRKAFGMLGRVVGNKGSQLLAHAALELPAGWNVEIHGAGSIGAGPSFTYRLYATLKARGFTGSLENGDVSSAGKLKALKPERWAVQAPDGRWVSYWGPYEDTVGTAGRFRVHVNLTESNFSHGMIEFVGLEAMDAGCIGIYPTHVLGAADYMVLELTKFTSPPPIRSEHNQPGTDFVYMDALADGVYDELVELCGRAAEYSLEDTLGIVKWNREVIRTAHDPAILARRFIEECGRRG